ncbi:MAG: YihY/virulence factor BrkB family protein [Egibacteraceae bacterium]
MADAHKGKREGFRQRLVAWLDSYQRTHSWMGFPLAVAKKFGDDQAGNLAALIAYYGFFSLFPLLLALVTILGFVLSDNPALQERILSSALANFPVLGDQLRQNVRSLNGSGVALALGLAGLLWAGLAAITATENAMNEVWDVRLRDRPRFVASKLRGLLMLVVLGGGVILTTMLAGFGAGSQRLELPVRMLGFVLSFGVNTALFLLAFKVLTDVPLQWRQLLPGAVVGSSAWVILQAVGGYVVNNELQRANQTYGAFAVVIGLLSWLYLQAQITLIAAELNVVRARRLWPRRLTQDTPLSEADQRTLHRLAEVEERIPEEDVNVRLVNPDSTTRRS